MSRTRLDNVARLSIESSIPGHDDFERNYKFRV